MDHVRVFHHTWFFPPVRVLHHGAGSEVNECKSSARGPIRAQDVGRNIIQHTNKLRGDIQTKRERA